MIDRKDRFREASRRAAGGYDEDRFHSWMVDLLRRIRDEQEDLVTKDQLDTIASRIESAVRRQGDD